MINYYHIIDLSIAWLLCYAIIMTTQLNNLSSVYLKNSM